jgi:hypothetical protein
MGAEYMFTGTNKIKTIYLNACMINLVIKSLNYFLNERRKEFKYHGYYSLFQKKKIKRTVIALLTSKKKSNYSKRERRTHFFLCMKTENLLTRVIYNHYAVLQFECWITLSNYTWINNMK